MGSPTVIEGTTNVEDTFMDGGGGQTGKNYGGSASLVVEEGERRILIRAKNIASELGAGATITSCVLSLYCSLNQVDGNISAYRVFKPWVEGTQVGTKDPPGATWVDWDNDDWEWTDAGCDCANDDGVDNSADDGACDDPSRRDRKATAEDSVAVDTVNTWYHWTISNALAQGWYDLTINEEGVILIDSTANGLNVFYSTESLEAEKPYWTFTYTVAGARRIFIVS